MIVKAKQIATVRFQFDDETNKKLMEIGFVNSEDFPDQYVHWGIYAFIHVYEGQYHFSWSPKIYDEEDLEQKTEEYKALVKKAIAIIEGK